MPIRVQGPNGEIVEFPDGMNNDAIVDVMRQHFGGPEAPAQTPQPQVSPLADAAKTIPSGLARGVSGTIGLQGSAGHGMRWLNNKVRMELGYPDNPDYVAGKVGEQLNPLNSLDIEPKDIQNRIESVTGPLYEPQTATGRYANSISEMAGAAALPIGAPSQAIQAGTAAAPALASYAKNLAYGSLGSGVAGQTAKELGAPVQIQLAATIAGGMAAPNLANAAFSKGPPDPRMIEKTLAAEAAQQEGINVPKAAIAGSVQKPVAGRLAALPLVGSPLNNAARTSLDQTGQRAANIADAYGTGSRATAGANMRDALVDYIENGTRAPQQALYNRVNSLVDQNMLHPLPATQQLAAQLQGVPSATMRAVNERALDPIMEDLQQAATGGLPYQGISQMRSAVGAMLDNELNPDYATIQPVLNRLYGSLSSDLGNAVQRAGQPGAIQAFEQANTAAAAFAARREALQKIVGRTGDNSGENVFDSLVQMAQNKGKAADLSKLALARRTVDPQTWGDFSSAFVRRMGLDPKTGDFSPDRFLTAYGNLSPQGRNILFRGQGASNDLADSLDRLARISRQFSEFYKMGNPSGTAGSNFVAALFGVGGAGLLGIPFTASSAGGMWGMSKWLASPANVDKMSRTLAARLAATRNPNPGTIQRATQLTAALSNELNAQNDQR